MSFICSCGDGFLFMPVVPLHCDRQCVRTTAVAMYTIAKTFAFSASHIIGGLPSEHPCSRLHGHNYEVEVILQAAALDDVGFVRDYRELSALKKFLDKTGDHNHLNDVLGHDKTRASGISMPHALTAPLLSVCILDVAS